MPIRFRTILEATDSIKIERMRRTFGRTGRTRLGIIRNYHSLHSVWA